MASVKNVPAILDKIVGGTAPPKFSVSHLKNIGLASSADRGIIPILKDLGFLSSDGSPTKRYHEFRNPAQSKKVLGEALREAYEDVFHVSARPIKSDRAAVEGIFKSVNNVSDRIAELQAMTFFALRDKADVTSARSTAPRPQPDDRDAESGRSSRHDESHDRSIQLRHNIEVHLPATKDIEVYSAIFKALREHLLD
jgi:hypothetical protein